MKARVVLVTALAASVLVGGAIGETRVAPKPASTDALTPQRVPASKFVARVALPRAGGLRSGVLGTHVVAVVPLYLRTPPSRAVFNKMAKEAAAFWAREVPGTKFSWRWKTPQKVSFVTGCVWDLVTAYAVKRSGLNPWKSHMHVLAWVPECQGGGLADLLRGNGRLWVGDSAASVLAHELGHNMGLNHSNSLGCRDGAGRSTALSSRCVEVEYEDPSSVMGSMCELPSTICRIPGPDIYELIGQSVRIQSGQSRTVTLATGGNAGLRTAVLTTKFGALFLDATPAGASPYGPKIPSGVQVHVLSKLGNAIVRQTDPTTGTLSASRVTMEFLDSWVVAGTSIRALVTQSSARKSTLQFLPIRATDVAPAAPFITSLPLALKSSSYTATWSTSVDEANLLGHIVKWTDNGSTQIFRVPATASSVQITALTPNTTGTLKVWSVSKQGLISKPTTQSVPVKLDFLTFSYSGNLLLSVTSADQWIGSASVAGPGDLTWTIDAGQAAKVTGWAINVLLPGGASYDYHFAAGTRTWTLPSEVLVGLDPAQNTQGLPVTVSIALEGLGRTAVLDLYPVFP